jgi:hypothetical protein
MRFHRSLMLATALVCSAPAMAGEQVLYGPAPAWVAPADLDAALRAGGTLVLFDKQVRLEDGTVNSFSDVAFRIDSPDALTNLGTLKLGWLPDKGDLLVHRLEIVRDGQVVDLLAMCCATARPPPIATRRCKGLCNRSTA